MPPQGDYVIDADTMDEVWRLLCALFTGSQSQRPGAWWREPKASVEERAVAEQATSDGMGMSIGDLASSFDDNG